MKLLYLSRLPGANWYARPSSYLLSVHVGEDARSDPPPHPGRYSTLLLQPTPPQAVAPEEEALRQRIGQAIDAMRAQDGLPPPEVGQVELECRFKHRIAVRLSEEGPGPAAGGPPYFRIDVWAERQSGMFGRENQRELFARVFVPVTEPKWHRRPCTWPAVNAQGQDVAYVTCEFAFVQTPSAVKALQAVDHTSDHVALSWIPLPDDSICPVLGYRVEAAALHREKQPQSRPGALQWQTVGELDGHADPGLVVPHLRPDTRYRFRVRAFSEAGAGDAAEVEATTGPCAPGACGQPRLAGCAGPVLSVEWDPPLDDGGVEVVLYRVWVRPFTASKADPAAWLQICEQHHNKGGVQRTDIHTEELNPSVSRYLLSVAAVNGAGEVGPATPDGICLPFPNPCAVCGPTPPQALPALGDYPSSSYLRDVSANVAGTITLMEQGKKPERVPILPQEESFSALIQPNLQSPQWNSALVQEGAGQNLYGMPGFHQEWDAYADNPYMGNGGEDLQQPYLDGYEGDMMYQHHSPPADFASFHPDFASFHPAGMADEFAAHGLGGSRAATFHGVMEQQEAMRMRLQEKREQLDASLLRYSQVGSQLKYSPENELLRQSHEEAEIEAAGYQAEVAVLSQKLNDLDEALRVGAAPAASFNLES